MPMLLLECAWLRTGWRKSSENNLHSLKSTGNALPFPLSTFEANCTLQITRIANFLFAGIVSVVDGSSIALTLLTVVIIVWFALENFVYEEYCRYTFTIYPVLIFGLSALVDKLQQLQNADRNLFIASLNLSLAEVALAARIGLFAWRWNKRAKSKAE